MSVAKTVHSIAHSPLWDYRKSIVSLAEALSYGTNLSHCKVVEWAMIQGVNRLPLALHQTEALDLASEYVEEVYHYALRSKVKIALLASPFILGIAAAKTDAANYPWAKTAILSVQKNIVNITQVVAVACAVAQIRRGNHFRGWTTIACLVAGWLSREKWIGEAWRNRIDYFGEVVSNLSLLVTGSVVWKLFSCWNLLDIALDNLFAAKVKRLPVATADALNPEELEAADRSFRVNPAHFSMYPLSAAAKSPDHQQFVNLEKNLLDLFKRVYSHRLPHDPRETNPLELLFLQIAEDKKFREVHGSIAAADALKELKLQSLMREYIRQGLRKFAAHFGKLENQDLKNRCTSLLAELLSENKFSASESLMMLAHLGLGAHHCTISEAINTLRNVNREQHPVQEQVLFFLEKKRETLLHQFVKERIRSIDQTIAKVSLVKWFNQNVTELAPATSLVIGDPDDLHGDHRAIQLFGRDLHIRRVEEVNDEIFVEHRIGPIGRFVAKRVVESVVTVSNVVKQRSLKRVIYSVEADFARQYSAERIREWMYHYVNGLAKENETEFVSFLNWFNSFGLSVEVEEKCSLEVEEKAIVYSIDQKYIDWMLVKMRILELAPAVEG